MINFIIYSFQLYIIEITFVLPLNDSLTKYISV